jgi:distribution and morphology protein 10
MLNLQHDTGRWCTEYTYSAEDSMVGVRVLHNFGKLGDESERSGSTTLASRPGGMKRIDEEDAMEGGLKGRISAGAEVYFSAKEKSAGGCVTVIVVRRRSFRATESLIYYF